MYLLPHSHPTYPVWDAYLTAARTGSPRLRLLCANCHMIEDCNAERMAERMAERRPAIVPDNSEENLPLLDWVKRNI